MGRYGQISVLHILSLLHVFVAQLVAGELSSKCCAVLRTRRDLAQLVGIFRCARLIRERDDWLTDHVSSQVYSRKHN